MLTFLLSSVITKAECGVERVANIINFVRATEPRRAIWESHVWITDSVLLETVERQLDCMKVNGLHGTFLMQYDALVRPSYQKLLKTAEKDGMEVGGWWEITEPHCIDAGIEWRGRYPWDWHANVGFSVGYTQEERKKLVDVYMKKFRDVFGTYPKSVGSWFIDSYSLNYMKEKYGIIASTACRDQIGTDGYNMWGGYWQGAYYPSKQNFFIPAQSKDQQIDVPVFRMLGSDPIEQYDSGMGGNSQGVVTLEPVYESAGGNPEWVDWYFDRMTHDPAMTLCYFQAGQENMFTWRNMHKGFEYQMKQLARLSREGKLHVETLAESGAAFSKKYNLTPPSAISVTEDFGKSGKKTVWYNSRYYRMNLMWEGDKMFIRDIHLFDQNQQSIYLTEPCKTEFCEYWTLPIVEGNVWSTDSVRSSVRFYSVNADGLKTEMKFGEPVIKEAYGNSFTVTVPVIDHNASLVISLNEKQADFELVSSENENWCAVLVHHSQAELPFTSVDGDIIKASFRGFPYSLSFKDCEAVSTLNSTDTNGLKEAFAIHPKRNSIRLSIN